MKGNVLGIVLVLVASMAVAAIAPAFAENLHVPEGAKIIYYAEGESSGIDLPSNFPLNVPPWRADKMKIYAKHIEGGDVYTEADIADILVLFHCPGLGGAWVPWAHLYSSIDAAGIAWIRQLTSGLPPEDPVNIKHLPNDVVVERHGNSITVSLKTAQTLKAGIPRVVYFTLPPFDLELEKVGGSVHRESVSTFAGWPRASGWTEYVDEIGFNANGVFTCTDWGYNAEPMTDCFIVMHGNMTFVPPP